MNKDFIKRKKEHITSASKQEEMFLVDANLGWFHIFREMVFSGDLKKLMKCPSSIGVYLVIKSMVNRHTGVSFPSVDTLMEHTGKARGTIHKSLDTLEEAGYIEKGKSTSGNKNVYRVKEKILGRNKNTGEQSVMSFDYLSSSIGEATAEIKNFMRTGKDSGKNQYLHIEHLTLNLQNNFGDNNTNHQNIGGENLLEELSESTQREKLADALVSSWSANGVGLTECLRRYKQVMKTGEWDGFDAKEELERIEEPIQNHT